MDNFISQELRAIAASIANRANGLVDNHQAGIPLLPPLKELAEAATLLAEKLGSRVVAHGQIRFVLREVLIATEAALKTLINELPKLPVVGSSLTPRNKTWGWLLPCAHLIYFCAELINCSDNDQQCRGIASMIGQSYTKEASDALDVPMRTKGILLMEPVIPFGGDTRPTTARGELGETTMPPTPSSVSIWSKSAKFFSNLGHHGSGFNDELCRACLTGNLLIVASYITGKLDLHAQNKLGMTPLECAIIGDQSIIVNVLVSAGARMDGTSPPSGTPPLFMALEIGAMRAAKALVDKGANLYLANAAGQQYFVQLCQQGNMAGVEFLLDRGAFAQVRDSAGAPAPVIAARDNNSELCQLLVRNAFPADEADRQGRTALSYAAIAEDIDLMSFLIDRGAKVNCKTPGGSSMLFDAIKDQRYRAMQLLLERGAFCDRTTTFGPPMLIGVLKNPELTYNQKRSTVKQLLENGCSVDFTTTLWRKPVICYVIEAGYSEMIGMFLEHGARHDVKLTSGDTLLCRLVRDFDESAVRTLLAKGADVNQPNKNGEKPMLLAVRNSSLEMVRILSEAGGKADDAAMTAAGKLTFRRESILEHLRWTATRAAALAMSSPSG
ncbi:hypothetical protein CDD82_1300 [Ophiocordyceps australis]|uniref:Uncharacterized protein n=1 Tax=Ophiocordyceps australis TaxID=1399860 RepID=A0A2C5XCR4_9HYPO|nr:hypothetical protein CDD82_1300 [Ophiocordyceps australis]